MNSTKKRNRRRRYRNPTTGAPARNLAIPKPISPMTSIVVTSSYAGTWTLGSPQAGFGGRFLVPLQKFYVTLSNFANSNSWSSTWDLFRIEEVTVSFHMNPLSTAGGVLMVAIDPDGGSVPDSPNNILSYRNVYTMDLHPVVRPVGRVACRPGYLVGNVLQTGLVDITASSTAQFNCFQTGWWDTNTAVTDIILYCIVTARIRLAGAR